MLGLTSNWEAAKRPRYTLIWFRTLLAQNAMKYLAKAVSLVNRDMHWILWRPFHRCCRSLARLASKGELSLFRGQLWQTEHLTPVGSLCSSTPSAPWDVIKCWMGASPWLLVYVPSWGYLCCPCVPVCVALNELVKDIPFPMLMVLKLVG